MRHKSLSAAAIALSVLALPAMAQEVKPFNLTAAGGSAEGLLTNVNSGVDRAIAKAYPGSTITYQVSKGGMANIALIDAGKTELGYLASGETVLAKEGKEPFNKPITSMRAIAQVAGDVPMVYVITKSFAEKHGIKDFSDIATKKPPIRLALQQRGNIVSFVAEDMLKEIGVTPADIKSWGGEVYYVGGAEFGPYFSDNRVDAKINATQTKGRTIVAVERAADVQSLTVDKALMDKVAARWGWEPYVIPKGTYEWQPFDLNTMSLSIILSAGEKMSDQMAYNLAKALVENIDDVRAAHPSLKGLTPQFMASFKGGPYHPGAEKYYREKGLMK